MKRTLAHATRIALLVPALALGGCLSLGAEPPASLLTLTPSATAEAGQGTQVTNANAVWIFTPETPAKLDVLRVPVQVSDTEIAYLQDAFWVEKPARLFRRLMGEAVRAKGGNLVLDSDNTPLVADRVLRGTIREFGYDASSNSVVVQFDAIRSVAVGEGQDATEQIETRRFEMRESGILPEAADVGPALNRAANEVADQVAQWVLE
ncbi:MAG: ABC-type transport auxiliary lipoprotein family protein [Pseudomonadota bacterium]